VRAEGKKRLGKPDHNRETIQDAQAVVRRGPAGFLFSGPDNFIVTTRFQKSRTTVAIKKEGGKTESLKHVPKHQDHEMKRGGEG